MNVDQGCTIQATSEWFWQTLIFAIQSKDIRSAKTTLRGIATLIKHVRQEFQQKYGRLAMSHSMGVKHRLPSWKGKQPQEIIDDLYTTIEFESYWAEKLKGKLPSYVGPAKQLARQELRRIYSYIRAFVRELRKFTMKNWPGWWTAEREADFIKYLPKRRN